MKNFFLFIALLLPVLLFSQNEASTWYFGRYSGLDFSTSPPTVIDDVSNDFFTYEGCATISDCNGVLFYTDGVSVWDNTHSIMPNGTGLFGNSSSTQSAIIVPKPLDATQYYIFTTDVDTSESGTTDNGINYSLVDLTLGTAGDIDPTQKNINLVNNRAYEKLAAVNKSNNIDYWVISYYEDQFLAWTVDSAGVNSTPVISTAGISNSNSSRGYLKISPDGTKIISANFGPVSTLMLYDFNPATGIVSNETQLLFDVGSDSAYGVEFSPQSTKLYATTSQFIAAISPPGKLYQFDLSNANNRTLIDTSPIYTRGAIQLGIDGKIYRALASTTISHNPGIGTTTLGVINNPELIGIACNYVDAQVDLTNGGLYPNNLVFEGLPPFISSSFLLPNIAGTDACLGTPNDFIINSTCPVDSVVWDFGELDPSSGLNFTSVDLAPSHTYSTAGTFTVIADVTIGGVTETSTIDVIVFDLPVVTTPVSISQCDDDIDGIINFDLTQAASLISSEIPVPTITYFLTEQAAIDNDSTNEILTPNSFFNNNAITTNTVWTRVVNANNCVTTSEINLVVTNINIPPDIVPPFTVCDNIADGDDTNGITIFDFSSASNIYTTSLFPEINLVVTYYETQTDALSLTSPIDPTNFTNTITITQDIIVRIDNTVTGCLGLTTLTLNVQEIPQFDVIPATTLCLLGATQIISVENPSGNYSYEWLDSSNNVIGTDSEIEIGLADTYTVIATDIASPNCTSSEDIIVFDSPVVTSSVSISQCDDDIDGIIDFDLTQANSLISSELPAPSITYFLTEQAAIDNDSTNEIVSPATFFNNNAITTNTVWARIMNANNCAVTSQINLVVVNINIPPDIITPYIVCDDIVDGDDTNGFTLFNFSSATNSYITALIPEINLVVTYYETQVDALNLTSAIDPTNFRNTIVTTQDIIVRIDNTVTGCLGLTTLTLIVQENPQFDVVPATTICLFGETQIISVDNTVGDYTYEWLDSSNNVIGTDSEIEIGLVDTYTVIATDTASPNCTSSKTIDVISEPIMPLLNFDITNIEYTESSFNQNTITVLIDNLPVSTYQFALNDGPFQLSNIFENLEAGVYTVTIRDISNCLEAKVTISIIYIPNFFTPNGDGFNDSWHVTGIEFQPDSNVYVYNRFGKLIKVLNPLGPGWNGLYKGNPLPSSDYWYKVELEDGSVLKGHFSLIR